MNALLQAKGLCKKFGRRQVVKNVSLHVDAGEIVGLLGPNGAGKTTTFNMVAGLLRPDEGSVLLGPHELGDMPLYARAQRGLGYLPQESSVFRGLSVEDNIRVVYETWNVPQNEASKRIENLLEEFHLTHVRHNKGSELSGGEKRRLEMARVLAIKPSVLLLDEPFAGVDPIAVGDIRGFIQHVAQQGIGVLITDHNVRETLGLCQRAYVISHGAILVSGSPETVVADPQAKKLYLGEDFALR
jgi:lipopolysaccharide export system ATP-binding protein